jgi:parvulin-like peptidyl-prolyl isomerase
MKKDGLIAIAVVLIVVGVTFGLAAAKLDLKPITPPATAASAAASHDQPVNGHVIMRVNGEGVTEEEFTAAFAQLPEEMQRQLANPQGKSVFAEQLVKYKLLEQEARRLGYDKDARVAAAVNAERMNILASAAAQKLVTTPNEKAVNDFYQGNKAMFESVEVSHILLAYSGGMAPPRPGKNPPPQEVAMAQGREIVKQLRAGANFAQAAAQVSDDTASAERGGDLGTFGHGALPPELERVVFTLKDGQISDPIPSRFGVHIFLLRKHGTQPIEQVRTAIAQQVRNQSTMQRLEVLRRAAKVDFDAKFFPDLQPKGAKKPS